MAALFVASKVRQWGFGAKLQRGHHFRADSIALVETSIVSISGIRPFQECSLNPQISSRRYNGRQLERRPSAYDRSG
ncbi:MAG: hypothetical protein ACI8TQ_000106 [Planctomycetota bacterium]|jgi:hypothetical protein